MLGNADDVECEDPDLLEEAKYDDEDNNVQYRHNETGKKVGVLLPKIGGKVVRETVTWFREIPSKQRPDDTDQGIWETRKWSHWPENSA